MGTEISDIFCVGDYEPYKIYDYESFSKIVNPKFNKETGGYMLDLKAGREVGVNVYFKKMCEIFDSPGIKSDLINNNWAITCVPSSKEGKIGEGLERLISKLCKRYNIDNMCGNLYRKYSIKKLSEGGNRDIRIHLNSIIAQDEDLFKDRRILIIDDVTTTGNSLTACERIVKSCGAIDTLCIALGKTVKH